VSEGHGWISRSDLAAIALASSLGLHLHQVGERTLTSKLLNMPGARYRLAPLYLAALEDVLGNTHHDIQLDPH
jgi:hypothetical protein